jgi:hypothetical protein
MTQQTQQRDIERLLDGWFETGPSRASDRVLVVVADRVHRQTQRPRWLVEWRRSNVSTPIKVALLAAALALAAIGGALLIAGRSQSIPTPSTRPSAQPGFKCDDFSPCAGNLEAGTHSSSVFQPVVTYDVPIGWRNTFDGPDHYIIDTLDMPAPTIVVKSDVAIPEQNDTCGPARKEGVGNGVEDWVSFLTTHPGLVASDPRPVVIGGRSATQITVTRATSWTKTCGEPEPIVVLITQNSPVPTWTYWMGANAATLTLVDANGETVIILVESIFEEIHQGMLEAAMPVMQTLRFGGG